MLCTCMCTAYVLSTTLHLYKLFGVYNSVVTLCAVYMKGYTNCCAIVHVYVAKYWTCQSIISRKVLMLLSFYVLILACRFSPVCYAVLAHALKIISVDLRTPLIVNKSFCCKDRRPISSTTKCNFIMHYKQNLWQPTNKLNYML